MKHLLAFSLAILAFATAHGASADTSIVFKDIGSAYEFKFTRPLALPVTDKSEAHSLTYTAIFQDGKLAYTGGTPLEGLPIGAYQSHAIDAEKPYCAVRFFIEASSKQIEDFSNGKGQIQSVVKQGAVITLFDSGIVHRITKYNGDNVTMIIPQVELTTGAERLLTLQKEQNKAANGTNKHYVPKVGNGIYDVECGSRVGFGFDDTVVTNVTIQSAESVFPAGIVEISETPAVH